MGFEDESFSSIVKMILETKTPNKVSANTSSKIIEFSYGRGSIGSIGSNDSNGSNFTTPIPFKFFCNKAIINDRINTGSPNHDISLEPELSETEMYDHICSTLEDTPNNNVQKLDNNNNDNPDNNSVQKKNKKIRWTQKVLKEHFIDFEDGFRCKYCEVYLQEANSRVRHLTQHCSRRPKNIEF